MKARIPFRKYSSSISHVRPIASILSDKSAIGQSATVQGWVRSVREQKSNTFLDVNDGSCLANIQICLSSDEAAKLQLSTGSSVKIVGTIAQGPSSTLELTKVDLSVIGAADATFPLQKKRHTYEYLREIAHLRARTNTFGAVLRVRNAATMAVHQYFQSSGFIQIHTPILNSSDCEGAGELFVVNTREDLMAEGKRAPSTSAPSKNFFNVPECYLTVSGQLEAEIFATAMSKVYTFGPTFRAEDSHTPRHLSEFWMIEPEIAFADLDHVMDVAEGFVQSCVKEVMSKSAEDLDFFNKRIDTSLLERLAHDQRDRYARMTYTEAVKVLQEKSELSVTWGDDLARDHERWLCERYTERPVFVTHYPKTLKPFYMRQTQTDEIKGRETVECCDLLVPKIGELIGGSAREERTDLLINRMKSMNLDPEAISWYIDLRRYGTVPHGGFGLGFERFLLYVTGMENIRDVIPIPRHPGYCKF
jgi:asparaginyl-tRNA synthetase